MNYFEIFLLELMATNFSPSSGSYVLNKFPSISQWSNTGPSWPSCVCSRGHIFSLIIMKLDQHACLDEIWHKFENGSCQVKNKVTRSNVRKTLCMLLRQDLRSDTHEIWSECLPR